MVGAGIFALLGAASEVAGAAVWLSFLIAGVVAGLQGYSFAKLGARYPQARDIISSVALTFFAFLGFGIITFTAKDLAKPSRQLPKAMFLALGIATVIYVAIALGVFGTLTVALVMFTTITAVHLRIRAETGANLLMLIPAIVAAGAVFVTFVFTTLIHEPASIATLAGILVLSVALDYGWKHFRDTRTKNVQLAH